MTHFVTSDWDDTYWDFGPAMSYDCNNHMSDLVVQCQTYMNGQECLQDGDQCAMDLDCCEHMFCSPVTGNCHDPVTSLLFIEEPST